MRISAPRSFSAFVRESLLNGWFVFGFVSGSCPGTRLSLVRVWFVSGSCRVRVWFVSGSCLFRVWFVFGLCLVRVWFVSGSCLVRVGFVSSSCWCPVFGSCLVRV